MNIAASTVVAVLPFETQVKLIDQTREVIRRSPLVRPTTPRGQPMRVRVSAAGRLGWVGDGAYRYSDTDPAGNSWPPMPSLWAELASEHAGEALPWDSAIINWYDLGAALGFHRDRSELDQSLPIVTISLGDACSWAVKLGDDDPVSRCKLESGAVTLLAGRTRGALHSVERIIHSPMFSPLSKPGRISITIRVAGEGLSP